eukprot:14926451-Alexandrium_andersonii.AAC.1
MEAHAVLSLYATHGFLTKPRMMGKESDGVPDAEQQCSLPNSGRAHPGLMPNRAEGGRGPT